MQENEERMVEWFNTHTRARDMSEKRMRRTYTEQCHRLRTMWAPVESHEGLFGNAWGAYDPSKGGQIIRVGRDGAAEGDEASFTRRDIRVSWRIVCVDLARRCHQTARDTSRLIATSARRYLIFLPRLMNRQGEIKFIVKRTG